jgi:hypothetical protein
MRVCKELWLKYQIRKYGNVLLKAGMKEAFRRGKNLRFGLEVRAMANDNVLNTIYLPENEKGIDASQLMFLGIEAYPEEGRRYLVYSKILDRLQRKSRSPFSKI